MGIVVGGGSKRRLGIEPPGQPFLVPPVLEVSVHAGPDQILEGQVGPGGIALGHQVFPMGGEEPLRDGPEGLLVFKDEGIDE